MPTSHAVQPIKNLLIVDKDVNEDQLKKFYSVQSAKNDVD